MSSDERPPSAAKDDAGEDMGMFYNYRYTFDFIDFLAF